MIVYADTSALVKLVHVEEGTTALHRWLAERRPALLTSTVGAVELRRASARVDPSLVPVADAVLERMHLIEPTPATTDLAARVGPSALRTLDAIHCATVVMIADLDAVLCYDQRLTAVLERIGVAVVAPGVGCPPAVSAGGVLSSSPWSSPTAPSPTA